MRRQASVGGWVVVVALLAAVSAPSARAVDRRAEYADAFVDADTNSGEWTIGNDAIRYTVGIRQNTLRLVRLSLAGSSRAVTPPRETDAVVTLDGDPTALGTAASGFAIDQVAASTGSHFVSLAVRFKAARRGLMATRHYVVYPGAAAVELWTTFETTDGEARVIENLNAYELALTGATIDYVTGLDAPSQEGGAFARRQHSLHDGERFMLGSPTMSTETAMPFFSVADDGVRVFSGLAWSGGWSAALERRGDILTAAMGLPPMSAIVRPGRPVEGPHAFIGATPDRDGADTAAVTRFVRESRAGRALPALTTFNTWFVHGINIDEATIRRDIEIASTIGIELFQVDAGWYPRGRPAHQFDFTDGLGSWHADPTRFPSGLHALSEYAHEHGMQFGLWVEPERVALSTIGLPGLAQESFLAQQQGAYQPGVDNERATDAQICLAHPAAKQWVEDRLIALIEQVRPDNLKWDFNRWVHCTRTDHGHPADGGNYEHTRALYDLLATIRQRFPNLTIENCSGGGHRLDFALARLTDTAWMDDRSAPSAHVRRNLNGLLHLFPSTYLFSYVMPHANEPMRGATDLPMMVRSRMPGAVGLATSLVQLGEGELNVLHQEFELAKRLRAVQQNATAYVLTPQRDGTGEWEIVQQLIPESGISYIFAFAERASGSIRVHLRGLRPDVTYEYRSADRGVIGHLRGEDLIVHGLEIVEAPESAAQVLVLQPVNP
jgi:alpha-galactosidase